MDYAFQGKHPPTKLAAMAIASNAAITQEQPWLANSAAINHVTSSLNSLSFPQPYNGQDQVIVGNDQNLSITHIGNVQFPTQTSSFHLKNVLRVPSKALNLASIYKFVMTISVGVILMKIFYLFKLWPQGMSFTRARVNKVSTLSTLVKLLICLFSLESAIMLHLHLPLGKFGITVLDIHMLKFCNSFFKV